MGFGLDFKKIIGIVMAMDLAKVNGAEIRYKEYGKKDGPALVFVSGLLDPQEDWIKYGQIDYFSKHFRVITYDRRSYEGPDSDRTYTFESHADDLNTLLDHLNIPKAYVCGMSLGGIIAQHFAVKYTDRLHGLALFNTCIDANVRLGKNPPFETTVKEMIKAYFTMRIDDQMCIPDPEIDKELKRREYEILVDQVYNFSMLPLGAINVPVLFGVSEHAGFREMLGADEEIILRKQLRYAKSLISDFRSTIIHNCEHRANKGNQEEFNMALGGFVYECETKRS